MNLRSSVSRPGYVIGLSALVLAMSGSAVAAPPTTVSCSNAKIGGQRKCIARGQFCTRAYQKDYKRYGFSCSKRDANGRWHLV